MKPASALFVEALRSVLDMVHAGATPGSVAAYVLCLDSRIIPSICRMVEDAAMPGTFAEAVFAVLVLEG